MTCSTSETCKALAMIATSIGALGTLVFLRATTPRSVGHPRLDLLLNEIPVALAVLAVLLAFALGVSPADFGVCRMRPGWAGRIGSDAAIVASLVFCGLILQSVASASLGLDSPDSRRASLFARVVGASIVPLSEELWFRGLMLSGLVMLWPSRPVLAALITSLCFGFAHQLGVAVFATCFGLASASLTLRSGSLLPSMVAHATWNIAVFFVGRK